MAALRAAAQLLHAAGADPATLQAAVQLLPAAGADPATAAVAHRAAVATGKQPVVDAAPSVARSGLGMAPEDAPLSAAAFRGQQANAALAAALLAAKSEASAAQKRVRVAALAWERDRATTDALALRVVEAERYLRISSEQPVDPEHGTSSSFQAPPAGSGARYDPTDPMVAQLHLQSAGVQNIRALVSILLDPASSSYDRWRDQVLLTLRRYALDDHVLIDSPIEARDVAWLRLDSVAMSWIFGTISLDLQDLVRTHGGTARQA
jgi:hypothetical protein